MRRKRIMVMGPSGCGKTSLARVLDSKESLLNVPLRKTQDIIYGKNTIDVPGSYLEIPWMYKYLIQTAQDACHILLLVDQSRCQEVYSPGFAKVFQCPVNGVIMKSDLSPEQEEKCVRQLERAKAAEPYFRISMVNGTGIDLLREYFLERYQL